MHPLTLICLLIAFVLIYGIGHWHWKECRRHRAEEQRIREVAEAAASDAASCAAVIDKLGNHLAKRRHLYSVRDEKLGVSVWKLE